MTKRLGLLNVSALLTATALVGATLSGCATGRHFPNSAVARSIPTTAAAATTTTATAGPALTTTTTPRTTSTTAAPARTTVTTVRRVTTTTAPAVSTTGATLAGCPLFPPDNPWRQNISTLPVDPHSAAWVASVGASIDLHPDFGSNPSYGIPYVVVPASQPNVPITFTAYGDQSDPGPYPVPANAPIEAGSDRHVLVASANCHLYEMYDASPDGHGGWDAASGAVFNLRSDALRPDGWTSADAAGLPILPGLVRFDEVSAGQIDHALRFTVAQTQDGFIHPATHEAGDTTDPDVPPMGARFRLKASFSLAGYTGEALVILQALKTYGMFVADNGSNWYISGATDPRWDDNDLDQLKTVPGSAFEVVETGPVLTSS